MAQFRTSTLVSYFEGWRAEIFMEFCTIFFGKASLCHLGIIQSGELIPLLPGDHEGGQVGGVDGEEHHGEQRPDRRHEPRRGSKKLFNEYKKRTRNKQRKKNVLNLIIMEP